MRHAIIAIVLALAGTAAAQPVLGRDTCQVTFVRAPDDVRLAIERWVAAEPTCTGAIELRVIPTDGGLYLVAQRPDGRIHERMVPDADAAGVLVASWVADAWTAAPPAAQPSEPVARHERAPVVPRAIDVRQVSAEPPRRARWLSVAGMLDLGSPGGGGVRAELDGVRWKWLVAGLSASVSNMDVTILGATEDGTMNTWDARVVPYVAAAFSGERWELRAVLGYGYNWSRADIVAYGPWDGRMQASSSGSGAVVEASLILSRRFGRGWAFATGPHVWNTQNEFYFEDAYPVAGAVTRYGGAVTWLAGVRKQI